MNQSKNIIQVYVLWLLDAACVFVSYMAATQIRYGVRKDYGSVTLHYMVMVVLLLSCTLYHFFVVGNRDYLKRGYFRELMEVLKYDVTIEIAAVVIVFMARWAYYISRMALVWFFFLNLILTLIVRLIAKKLFRRMLKGETLSTKFLVVAEEQEMESTIRNLMKQCDTGLVVVGAAFADRVLSEEESGKTEIEGVPIVGGMKKLTERMITVPFDEVFINTPDIPQRQMADIINGFEEMGAVVHYCLDLPDVGLATSTVGGVADYSVISYSMHTNSYKRLMIKRLMDILGGFVGIILTGIITLFLAPAIKLDSPGPVFFAQTRVGKNGRRFKIYKFRSMYMDAEERLKDLEGKNQMNGLMFKMENDPRITKVGKFIRKTSLDEFPQFLNIFKGDMSLVGTRPPTEKEFELYNEHYRRRLSMTPGLTGLWQVSGRSDITDFDEVVKLDLSYIDNWSLSLDFKILLQTVAVVFTGKGAE